MAPPADEESAEGACALKPNCRGTGCAFYRPPIIPVPPTTLVHYRTPPGADATTNDDAVDAPAPAAANAEEDEEAEDSFLDGIWIQSLISLVY